MATQLHPLMSHVINHTILSYDVLFGKAYYEFMKMLWLNYAKNFELFEDFYFYPKLQFSAIRSSNFQDFANGTLAITSV